MSKQRRFIDDPREHLANELQKVRARSRVWFYWAALSFLQRRWTEIRLEYQENGVAGAIQLPLAWYWRFETRHLNRKAVVLHRIFRTPERFGRFLFGGFIFALILGVVFTTLY